MEFIRKYEKNRISLNSYPFFRSDKLPNYENLPVKAKKIGENEYMCSNSKTIKIERTNINTKPFFRDLSKPLLLKNEFNSYNIEYVYENTRKSEDYGADNHIYMYYDNLEEFIIFLQVVDITPYLENEKLVFIFGEKDLLSSYPLDFKKEYGIDYTKFEASPLRVDEIKRIFVHWHNQGFSGNDFISGVFDFHKNLLTIPFFCFVGISYIYKKLLENKTVDEVYEALLNNENHYIFMEFSGNLNSNSIFFKNMPVPTLESFFKELKKLFPKDYKPAKDEWLKGMFLAHSAVLGREMNARIAPAVMFHSHFRSIPQKMEVNFDLFDKFKYCRIISLLRRRTAMFGSLLEWCYGVNNIKQSSFFYNIAGVLQYNKHKILQGKDYNMFLYCRKDYKYFNYTRIVRFEDLKLEPKATLEAILDFFDMEWDDSLMHTTANGVSTSYYFSFLNGKEIKDFDPTPVFKKREKYLSPFDYYRIELVNEKIYRPWGYKPQYYTDGKKYTNEEIEELYKKPWKLEEFEFCREQIRQKSNALQYLYDCLKESFSSPFDEDKNGEKLFPLPWLKPKEEFMTGKLYE